MFLISLKSNIKAIVYIVLFLLFTFIIQVKANNESQTLLNIITPGDLLGPPVATTNFANLLTGTTGTENRVTYIQFNGITSFSGGSGGVGISPHYSTPLPVTYTSIQANPINNEYIQVSWTTASEINNKGFEVTRSIDGFNFGTSCKTFIW